MIASSIRRGVRLLAVSAAVIIAATAGAAAVEIKMIASNAVKEPYLQLVPQFEKASGHRVAISWAGTDDIARRIREGEVADIVIAPSFTIDNLIKENRLAAGSRVDVAKSIIGVALHPGAPKPDLSSGEGLKQSLLAAKSIIISGGPSGTYLTALFQKWGIADRIKGKSIRLAPGASPGEAVARGDGDIGFTQVSELLAVKGIEYLGPLPADIQSVTTFSSGFHKAAPQLDAAKALLQFLTAPPSVPVLRKTGLEPG
jgi:molybdate transport system substrate-binding protein